ncbi:MAG: N-acetylglucosamine-6-phosphate deacetylase [Bacteroidales bacterium]
MNTNQPNFALVNGKVVLPDRISEGLAVLVNGDRIEGVVKTGDLGGDVPVMDVGGRYISPGLIDIHTHGGMGHDYMEATPEAFDKILRYQASQGITTLLATLGCAPLDEMLAAVKFTGAWMTEKHQGSTVAGLHMEGPYFSNDQKGAQDPRSIRTPEDGTADAFLEHPEWIKIFSFAPELPGAVDFTRRLVDLGILPAAGHSAARDWQVEAAMEAGLTHTIHIWSSQSSTIREGPWRKPGLLETTLLHDDLTAEMISDNRHLPPTLMKLAYKCKGPDKLCVISDAIEGAGLPEGTQIHSTGIDYEISNGVGILNDRTSFAGSVTLINRMIRILTDEVGVPLVEAVRMATLTPARIIGIQDRKGRLAAGKDADIAIFETDFSAWKVMIGGQWVA